MWLYRETIITTYSITAKQKLNYVCFARKPINLIKLQNFQKSYIILINMPYPQFMVSIITTMFHSVLKCERERIVSVFHYSFQCATASRLDRSWPFAWTSQWAFSTVCGIFRPKKLRNCHETFGNGRERLTVRHVYYVHDEVSDTFAKSRFKNERITRQSSYNINRNAINFRSIF